MLVLSRKVGERILIGTDIEVTVVRIANGSIRLGIEAPANTSVVRREVGDEQLDPSTPIDLGAED